MIRRNEVIPSPNIWIHPGIYEAENRGVDRAGVIEAAMRAIDDWADQTVVDVGCGTGFHLVRFASSGARVVGVEPHAPTAPGRGSAYETWSPRHGIGSTSGRGRHRPPADRGSGRRPRPLGVLLRAGMRARPR